MRKLDVQEVKKAVEELCIKSNYQLPDDVENALKNAASKEKSVLCKSVLEDLQDNLRAARERALPICQDTGMAVIFLEIGQEIYFTGGSLEAAVQEGVRVGYEAGELRKSIVFDPLRRENTGDNTPAIIYIKMIPGDKLKITVAPKGFGSENMSALKMLRPADGIEGIKNFVLQTVKSAGSCPCPPIIIGIGIGGDFEYAAVLAKKALCRSLSAANPDPLYAKLEKEILDEVNHLGIGAQGFGGSVTALGVQIEFFATHIAALPVAVNIGCHVTRHQTKMI